MNEFYTPAFVGGADPLSFYVHVPFCTVRCGYCDFNTYTTGFGPGADRDTYADSVLREIELAATLVQGQGQSVFFGGGTPTLLPKEHLRAILARLQEWGLAPGSEVTIEANPDTITPQLAAYLAKAGFTRVSLGMQSSVPSVLRSLERTHDPAHVAAAVQAVKNAGMQVSVDLIYGTQGESLEQWRESVQAAIALDVDHISAYSLVIEPGTKLGAQLKRGQICPVNTDEQAAKYEIAEQLLSEANYAWYEISNWARITPGEEALACEDATRLERASKHNLAYWQNANWWGFGPGAHSHWQGERFCNHKHPRVYAKALQQGILPLADGEIVSEEGRELERVMLQIRTAKGCEIHPNYAVELLKLADEGLVQAESARAGRAVLTLRGRLLADLVTTASPPRIQAYN